MLERVAVHRLEAGGLHLLRGRRPQKRMLHSAFWVHGGGELDLAAAAASLFGDGGACYGVKSGSTETRMILQQHHQLQQGNAGWKRADLIHLDFLYPSGALAFLRYLGSAFPRRKGNTLLSIGCGKREYSSSTRVPILKLKSFHKDPLGIVHPVPELGLERPEDDDFAHIDEFMKDAGPGHYESAWFHYWNSPRTKKTTQFVCQYLLQSSNKQQWIRVLSLLTSINSDFWEDVGYECVVTCYIRLDHPHRALSILGRSVKNLYESRNCGFEAFIRFYVLREKWELVMEAWRILRGVGSMKVYNRDLDRMMHLNTTALPSLKNPENFLRFVENTMKWANTIPPRPSGRAPPMDDELAEVLMKGCLSYVTRPKAPWIGVIWNDIWQFIRRRKGWLVTKSDWERTISYLAGTRQDAKATHRYLRFRPHKPHSVSLDLMNQVLRCFARLEDFNGMKILWDDIYLISDKRRPNRESHTILMAALARRGDSEGVLRLFEKFLEEFTPETPQELSHLIQAHVVRGDLRSAILWFNRLKDFRIAPNVVIYNILINGYRKMGDVDGAARRVQEMLDSGLMPDAHTYNIILKMCASRGDVAATENIFNLIKQSGLELTPYAYEALVSVYVAVKDMGRAEAVLEQVAGLSFDLSPTPIWNSVLSAHATMGNDERVSQIFELMHDRGVLFDYHTYGIMMHSLCVAGKMEAAEHTLAHMKEAGFHISTDKHAILMVGYLRQRDFHMVWETFKRMLADGVKADYKTLAVIVKSYAHAESEEHFEGDNVLLRSTEQFLAEITSEVRELDLTTFDNVKSATPPWLFTPLINVYFHKSAWDRAVDVFVRFLRISNKEEPRLLPNLEMYKSMMQVYLKGGDFEGVRSMWLGLKSSSIQRHKSIDLGQSGQQRILDIYAADLCGPLSIYIRAMARIKNIDGIETEVKSLQESGYALDTVNWNDYVQALVLAGRLAEAAYMCEKNLMTRWKEFRLYFFYQDPIMRGVEGRELPPVRPFVRTIEALATELKGLEQLRKRGDSSAKATLVDIFRNAPATWEACDGLEDMEGRASKEVMFRLQKSGEEQMRVATAVGSVGRSY